jgi:hypothetical protein
MTQNQPSSNQNSYEKGLAGVTKFLKPTFCIFEPFEKIHKHGNGSFSSKPTKFDPS